MATRQYIGARYVPKFYQNSVDGSTQWESNVVYEPLMYVTLTNGHMYISKKQVPATVGSPVNNIDYWLDIGSYNGFIEQLQNEIDDINNVTIPAVQGSVALKQDITDNNLTTTDKTIVGAINELANGKQDKTDNTLTTTDKTVVGAINELDSDKQDKTDNTLTTTDKTVVGAINELNTGVQTLTNVTNDIAYTKLNGRRIVILTDSYGQAPTGETFYDQLLATYPEFVDQDNIFMFAYGGAGFVSSGNIYEWEKLFFDSNDYQNVTNRDTITDFYVLGGCNDAGENVSQANINTNAISLMTLIKSNFPNARVYCGFIGFSQNTAKIGYFTTMNTIYNQLVRYGYIPLGMGQNWFHFTGFLTDTVHPNSAGARLIMSGLVCAIYHTENSTPNYPTTVTKTASGLIALANNSPNPTIKTYKNGNIVGLYTENSIYMTFSSAQTIALNGTMYDLFDIGSSFIEGGNEWTNEQLVFAQIYDGTSNHNCFAYVKFYNNKLQVKFYPTDPADGSLSATSITIGRFNFVSNTALM